VVDANTYRGKVNVKLGPVALSMSGQAQLTEIDGERHKARVKARGADSKGRGGSDSVIDFQLEPSGNGTLVRIHTNLTLSGSIAQYGRGVGMIQSVASQLIAQFGACLESQLTAGDVSTGADAATNTDTQVKPVSGISVLMRAVVACIKGWFGKAI
jgi:carbon monoxide dehydrogenase subunit G